MIRCAVCLLGGGFLTCSWAAADSSVADAAEGRQSQRIDALIQSGSDVNGAQADGMTALHWAVMQGDLASCRLLTRAGAEVKAANRYGITPLSLACQNGNPEIVALLLENGADPDTALPGGGTVLQTAARTGSLECVDLLLKRGAGIGSAVSRGQTALMWAAAEGHVAVTRRLIEAGADFRHPLPSGFTPLHFAVRAGQSGVVRLLLQAGAEVNGAILTKQASEDHPRSGTAPLILAVENGHFELGLELVRAGADPNDLRSGFAPLHALTWVRKPGLGEDHDGDPAPAGSGRVGSLDFLRALVQQGAMVNAQLTGGSFRNGQLNYQGATPLLLAAKNADLDMIRLLVELGADPLLPNADGCTPLMVAAGMGTFAPGEEAGTESEAIATVQYLLDRGASLDTTDRKGETAMHGAAYKSLPGMVRLLAEKGADIRIWNRPNQRGWTPLLIARGYRQGNYKPEPATIAALIEVMKAHGAEVPPDPGPR